MIVFINTIHTADFLSVILYNRYRYRTGTGTILLLLEPKGLYYTPLLEPNLGRKSTPLDQFNILDMLMHVLPRYYFYIGKYFY